MFLFSWRTSIADRFAAFVIAGRGRVSRLRWLLRYAWRAFHPSFGRSHPTPRRCTPYDMTRTYYSTMVSLWLQIHPSLIMFAHAYQSILCLTHDVLHEGFQTVESAHANRVAAATGVREADGRHQEVHARGELPQRWCCSGSTYPLVLQQLRLHYSFVPGAAILHTARPLSLYRLLHHMYVLRPSGFYTTCTSSFFFHSSLHNILCCYVLMHDMLIIT
jgi:hypothetical protein